MKDARTFQGSQVSRGRRGAQSGEGTESGLSFVIPDINLLGRCIMLLQKLKCRPYMKNVSLPKHAGVLRASEGTTVSAQDAKLFEMKPSDVLQSDPGRCKTYKKSSVINVLLPQTPFTSYLPLSHSLANVLPLILSMNIKILYI